jgi:type I restriction enzyme, S subunit
VSRIEDLIARLCPLGVPIRPFGEVGTFIRGRRFTKADQVDEGLPSIHYGEIYTHYGVAAAATISHVRSDLAPTLRFARPGDVIIAAVGETVEDVGKALAWVGTDQAAVHDDCFIFRSALDPKYVVYFMQSQAFNGPKEAFVARAKVKRLSADGLARLRIPVPPPEVQREIVRILDHFTELEAELQAELKARRVQYAFYREQLLTYPEGVRWEKMGDVLSMRSGYFISASEIKSTQDDNHPFPCYGGNGLRGYVAHSNHDGDYVLVGRQGALSGNVKRATGKFYATEHAVVVTVGPDVDVDWAFHMLTAMNLNQYVSKGAQPGLAVGTLNALRIAVPPLAEQKRTADILDKFDALVDDLSVGLPAELNARRKQFAYYRDRLLTFEELAA